MTRPSTFAMHAFKDPVVGGGALKRVLMHSNEILLSLKEVFAFSSPFPSDK